MKKLLFAVALLGSVTSFASSDPTSVEILCVKDGKPVFEISNAHMATFGTVGNYSYNVDFLLGLHPYLSQKLPVSAINQGNGKFKINAHGAILKSSRGNMSDYEDTLIVFLDEHIGEVRYSITSGYSNEEIEFGEFDCDKLSIQL